MTKQEIETTVSLFYPSAVKVYYINSSNGHELKPPFKYMFVSLGITSSIKTLYDLRDTLNKISYIKASLSTISTRRNETGRYFNEVIKVGDYSKEDQYRAAELDNPGEFGKVLDKEASEGMCEELTRSGHLDQVQRLREIMAYIDEKECWSDMLVLFNIVDGVPTVEPLHQKVNYMLDPKTGIEYRIGILIEETK